MKKIIVFATLSVFFLLSSCIPSLHSIVTKENRIIDDRLIGDWKMEEDFFVNDIQFTIETDDQADEKEGVAAMEKLIKELGSTKKYSFWKFERAVNFTARRKGEINDVKGLKMEFNSGVPSMLPDNMIITKKENLPFYVLSYQKRKGNIRYMKIELTKIGGALYMDIFPYGEMKEDGHFSGNFINSHTFAKVKFKNGNLLLYSFDVLKMEELIKAKKVRLKHEIIGRSRFDGNKIVFGDEIILTASTSELRAFIVKYGDDENLFEDPEELTVNNEKNTSK